MCHFSNFKRKAHNKEHRIKANSHIHTVSRTAWKDKILEMICKTFNYWGQKELKKADAISQSIHFRWLNVINLKINTTNSTEKQGAKNMQTFWHICCCVAECPLMSVDILGTSWDQCRSTVQYSFTSTETIRLVRTDSPGRPPRLLNSSWTMTACLYSQLLYVPCVDAWTPSRLALADRV